MEGGREDNVPILAVELVLAYEEGHGVEGRLGERQQVHADAVVHHPLLRNARQLRVHLLRGEGGREGGKEIGKEREGEEVHADPVVHHTLFRNA